MARVQLAVSRALGVAPEPREVRALPPDASRAGGAGDPDGNGGEAGG